MIKKIWTLMICLAIYSIGIGQIESSDPESTRILKKLADEYNSFATLKVDFKLTLDLPGQSAEIQNGQFIQKGDKYVLELDDQAIYTDGNYVWVHLKKNNEVQVNDVELDAEVDLLSPKDMLKVFYEGKDFIHAVVGNKGTMTEIEFKPVDKDAEYSKMRVSIDEKSNRMKSIKIFSKDGSRYTLDVQGIKPNYKVTEDFFKFNISKHPGIHIEDLRID